MKKTFLNLLYISIVPSIVVYFLTIGFSYFYKINPILVVRDLAQTCGYPIGVGMISNIGILLWASSGAITLFVSISKLAEREIAKLLLMGGIFSAILCVDDFFLLHDRYVGPDFLNITYLSMTILMLIKFWKVLLKIGLLPIIISLLFLSLSVFFDSILQQLLSKNYELIQLYEEFFKFLGIACWLNFWCNASVYSIDLKKIYD
tara:strand:- start:1149 stop:1760 length:612 start_codon:yes stop_codon:yes gene_type:complete